ncbi:hypothetical protein J1N35_001756 [Gossypium stocksii]|uniref:Retrotransposon gag domain-containing protein n=1 Tax=Gossypium stocksii TaxID=47602 RepID=A0A9D3WKY0_9ROSI|nr:hypothetical protein J1N35_001756 [Gossypium stocksii]
MNVLGASDVAKCKDFSTTLKGSSKDRYLSLPQGSVQNFSHLGQMFLGKFSAHRAIMNKTLGLILIKRREDKSLEGYAKGFHMVTLNTKNLEDKWVIDAFIMGLQNGYIQYSLMES